MAAVASRVASSFGSLSGKTFLVTGSSNGIGLECVKALHAAGADVVMACRPGKKADEALASVKDQQSAASATLLSLDLGDAASVKSCATAFLALCKPLHGLICNAGINGVSSWGAHTPGIETQFAVNFIGHYQLAKLLHDKLRTTDEARLIILSSESHRRVASSGFDASKELPPREENYDSLHAYAFSNLCRLLWARAAAPKLPYPVVSLHPGVVAGTGMLQHMGWRDVLRQVWLVLKWERSAVLAGMSVGEVAATQTWAAVAPVEELRKISGAYLNGNRGRALGAPDTPSALGQDDTLAAQVIEVAEKCVEARG